MMYGSWEFPSASYDSWKTTPPDYYDEDPDYGDDDAEAFYAYELESLDELAVFFETHEQVSN